MNLYILSSPLQLICAIESWLTLSTDSIFWIFLGKSSKADDLMLKLSDQYISGEKVYFSKSNNAPFLLIKKILKLKTFYRQHTFDNLFIGNIEEFSEKLCAINLKYIMLWSLDDGAKTLVLNNLYSRENNKLQCFKKKGTKDFIKLTVLRLFNLKSEKIVLINWFTIFDFEPKNGGKRIQHQLDKFKKKIDFKGEFVDAQSDTVYFIGANLINAGVIIDGESYYMLLSKIIKCYPNKIVVYLPHRFEDELSLKKIENIGFQIKRFEYILEIAFLKNNIYPYTIASFYSTALYSLSKLFPKTQVDFFKLDQNFINSKFLSGTQIVEQEYQSIFGIKKI